MVLNWVSCFINSPARLRVCSPVSVSKLQSSSLSPTWKSSRVLVVDKQGTGTGFSFLFVVITILVPIRDSPAPNLTQGRELWGSLSLWLRIYCMHWGLLSHTLHLDPIAFNDIYEPTLAGRRPHWIWALSERWGVISILPSLVHVDFTVPWKYLLSDEMINRHVPARKKKEQSREGGVFTQVDAKCPLLHLHCLYWEMLHLLVVIAQQGNIWKGPWLVSAWHRRPTQTKVCQGQKCS